MLLYLDNCCFNRPFDDQMQIRIRVEAEAKLKIQEEIRAGRFRLVWSYILDYENTRNPFLDRKLQISHWKKYAISHIDAAEAILPLARPLGQQGFRKIDSLHIACALQIRCDYFLTTDDGILSWAVAFAGIRVRDPVAFIKEMRL